MTATVVERAKPRPPDPRLSHPLRQGRARLRRELLAGEVTLADVLEDPLVADMLIVDVVRLQYRGSAVNAMALMGRAAARDGVNLLLQVRLASSQTKEWVLTNGRRWTPRANRQIHLLNEDELFELWRRKGPPVVGEE